MQRWELSAFDRKHLALVSVPRPAPGPGEALVAVDAVSRNYRDNLIMANRLGAEPPLPLVPASDMADERSARCTVGPHLPGLRSAGLLLQVPRPTRHERPAADRRRRIQRGTLDQIDLDRRSLKLCRSLTW